MCGRFTQVMSWRELHWLYSLSEHPESLEQQPRYNGAPTQDFAVCRLDGYGNRVIDRLQWGLVPAWSKDLRIGARMINARAESVHEKPAFGAAFRARRCLVPADGWFEWQRGGSGRQPYFLALADGSTLSFAALWERWDKGGKSVKSFTIITTAADEALSNVHHRQPAVINPEHFSVWFDNKSTAATLLDLVRHPRAGPYEIRTVSTRVNNVRNDDPDVLMPMPQQRLF